VKEGRQPGQSLVVASQQTSTLDVKALSKRFHKTCLVLPQVLHMPGDLPVTLERNEFS